jgi:hypothetical protein
MIVTKFPSEQFGVSLDFSADLGTGNTIARIAAVKAVNNLTGANSTAEVISSSPAPAISGTAVTLVLTGGLAGEAHTIVVQVVSSIGEEYEGDIALRIASDLAAPTGYCDVPEVCSKLPSFQRNQTGSISDDQIRTWINHGQSIIDGALLQRGVLLPVTGQEQLDFLGALNADYAMRELGVALQGVVTLQPGEYSTVSSATRRFEQLIQAIRDKKYDAFFGVSSWIRNSMAGADTDRSTPRERGENRSFGKNMKF